MIGWSNKALNRRQAFKYRPKGASFHLQPETVISHLSPEKHWAFWVIVKLGFH
jgi:hypothetical protein